MSILEKQQARLVRVAEKLSPHCLVPSLESSALCAQENNVK